MACLTSFFRIMRPTSALKKKSCSIIVLFALDFLALNRDSLESISAAEKKVAGGPQYWLSDRIPERFKIPRYSPRPLKPNCFTGFAITRKEKNLNGSFSLFFYNSPISPMQKTSIRAFTLIRRSCTNIPPVVSSVHPTMA